MEQHRSGSSVSLEPKRFSQSYLFADEVRGVDLLQGSHPVVQIRLLETGWTIKWPSRFPICAVIKHLKRISLPDDNSVVVVEPSSYKSEYPVAQFKDVKLAILDASRTPPDRWLETAPESLKVKAAFYSWSVHGLGINPTRQEREAYPWWIQFNGFVQKDVGTSDLPIDDLSRLNHDYLAEALQACSALFGRTANSSVRAHGEQVAKELDTRVYPHLFGAVRPGHYAGELAGHQVEPDLARGIGLPTQPGWQA